MPAVPAVPAVPEEAREQVSFAFGLHDWAVSFFANTWDPILRNTIPARPPQTQGLVLEHGLGIGASEVIFFVWFGVCCCVLFDCAVRNASFICCGLLVWCP